MITNSYRIIDIISKVVDNRGRNTDYYDFEKYPIIDNYMIKNELHPALDTATRFLSEDQFRAFLRGYIDTDDLLMTLVGNGIGNVTLSPHSECAIVQNTIGLTFDKTICDQIFLYYYFKTIKPSIRNLDRGSSQPSINREDIFRTRIQLPDIFAQKKVSSILLTYDNLIETNKKRIKELEQMAENLYREWFVRFRFPGHEFAEFEDSKMGRIPSGFCVRKMQDVISDYIGGGWGNDEEDKDYAVKAYVIRGTDFPNVKRGNVSSCPLRYHKDSNYKSRELHDLDIILEVSGGTAEQPVGRTLLVTQDTIDRLGGRVICASFCKQIQLKKDVVSPYYYYYWMQFLYDTRIIDRFQLQSTGIINFQFEYFVRKGEILLPPKTFMQKFDHLIIPIYNSISALSKQNENLIKQRDLLLPRLMSGKLEV